VKEICAQNTRYQISAADVRIKYFGNPDNKFAVIDQLNIYINSPKYFRLLLGTLNLMVDLK